MHVDMTKILRDSGSQSTTGQPAGHVVYTALPHMPWLWPQEKATLIGKTRWGRE